MEANHAQEQVERAFGREQSFYEILGVNSDATADEIKSAYRRKALQMHPDKGGDEEMFKALCVIHCVLSDSDKRSAYDQCGEADIEDEMNFEESEFWSNYFRALFPKLTIEKIEEFSLQYKGGEEERRDIVAAYIKYEGNFNNVFDSVILAEHGDEARIVSIIDEEIQGGNIEEYPVYTKQRAAVLQKGSVGGKKRKDYDVCGNDDDDNDDDNDNDDSNDSGHKKARAHPKKRASAASSSSKGVKRGAAKTQMRSLEEMILSNRSSANRNMASILATYEKEAAASKSGAGSEYDIDDSAFEATRAKLTAKGKKK